MRPSHRGLMIAGIALAVLLVIIVFSGIPGSPAGLHAPSPVIISRTAPTPVPVTTPPVIRADGAAVMPEPAGTPLSANGPARTEDTNAATVFTQAPVNPAFLAYQNRTEPSAAPAPASPVTITGEPVAH